MTASLHFLMRLRSGRILRDRTRYLMDNTTTKPLAVVTGASGGIGNELAKEFAQHGFDLLVAAEDPGLGSADNLRKMGLRRLSYERSPGRAEDDRPQCEIVGPL